MLTCTAEGGPAVNRARQGIPSGIGTGRSRRAFRWRSHSKDDGSVVAWGQDCCGQTDVPSGLSDVTAVSAGSEFAVALRKDGTVVAWGYNRSGQTDVPAGLSHVIAVSAGYDSSLALVSRTG
jgi:hypothetical protein